MASEIRVDKINSLSGVGTVTLSPTGIDIAGITTAATLRATTGIVTSLTSGSLTSLGAVSGTTGTFSGAVSGTTGTFTGAVSGVSATFLSSTNPQIVSQNSSGGVGVRLKCDNASAGTLSFSDAAADNQGMILYHHAFDRMQFSTAGSERARIDSSGRLMLGTTTEGEASADNLTIADSGNCGMTIRSGTSNAGSIYFSDGTSGDAEYRGLIAYNQSSDYFQIFTAGNERVRLTSSGQLLIGTTSTSGVSAGSDDIVIGSIGDSTTRGITFATTDSAAIRWADAGDNAMGRIAYSNSTDVMTFHTSNATRLRLDSDGMKFGSDSAAANALDDYEEGTFTPDWRGASALGTTTYGSYNSASYVKVGNQVTVRGYSELNGSSGGSGMWFIHNLPFNVKNGHGYRSVGSVLIENYNLDSDIIDVVCYSNPNTNHMHLRGNRDNANYSSNIRVQTDDNFEVAWTLTYQVT